MRLAPLSCLKLASHLGSAPSFPLSLAPFGARGLIPTFRGHSLTFINCPLSPTGRRPDCFVELLRSLLHGLQHVSSAQWEDHGDFWHLHLLLVRSLWIICEVDTVSSPSKAPCSIGILSGSQSLGEKSGSSQWRVTHSSHLGQGWRGSCKG